MGQKRINKDRQTEEKKQKQSLLNVDNYERCFSRKVK